MYYLSIIYYSLNNNLKHGKLKIIDDLDLYYEYKVEKIS